MEGYSDWNMRRDFKWARVARRVSFVFPVRKLPRRSSFLSLGKFFDFATAKAPAFQPSCSASRLGKLAESAKATVPSSVKKLCFKINVLSFGSVEDWARYFYQAICKLPYFFLVFWLGIGAHRRFSTTLQVWLGLPQS